MLSCDFSLIINVFKPTFDRFFFFDRFFIS